MASHSPLNKKGSETTVNTMAGGVRCNKTFRDEAAKIRYSQYFSYRSYTVARAVDHVFFKKAGIEYFQKLEQIGWGPSSPSTSAYILNLLKSYTQIWCST